MAEVVSRLFGCRPQLENPTLREIEAIQNAERALKAAEEVAKATQYLAKETQQKAGQVREEARRCQEVAVRVAAQAVGETARMRAQMKEAENVARRAQQLTEAANAARCEQELAEAAFNAAREDAERFSREAQEVQDRAQKMQERAKRAMETAKEEAERMQRVADEQRREAEAAKVRAEKMTRTAAEETRKANEAREDIERRLKEGIQPVAVPSPEELAEAKKCVQYREDCFHFAVTGVSGSGKSSLLNAFRGLRHRDAGAAAVEVTEGRLQTTRYHNVNQDDPYVWYDVPGVGMFRYHGWQYFNSRNLYVFDCIIVLFDNRFTTTDITTLTYARQFKIPTYVVRSMADRCIRNIMMDIDSEGDEEEDVERHNKLYKAARKQFIDMTRKFVRHGLEDANLPDQRVYIVCNTTLLNVVRNKMPKNTIDELELLNDLTNEAHARREARP